GISSAISMIKPLKASAQGTVRDQSGVIYIAMVVAICLVTTLSLLSAYEGSLVGLLRHDA
ncbi:MAG: hypothetical protein P8J90_00405, partial [Luminiphilus sp.]|nr:hypothetical protein [Luminiphilus sp.]